VAAAGELSDLPNIGRVLEKQFNEAGIFPLMIFAEQSA
jgi:predicted flap endonuclease-1-like 5' DNA nuclease